MWKRITDILTYHQGHGCIHSRVLYAQDGTTRLKSGSVDVKKERSQRVVQVERNAEKALHRAYQQKNAL